MKKHTDGLSMDNLGNYGGAGGMRGKAPDAQHGRSLQADGNAAARPPVQPECSSYSWTGPKVCFLFSLLLAASLPAWAEKADKDKPVNLESDTARVDDVQKLAIYEGHVVLTQGTLMITADRIDVRQDDRGFSSGEATGKPVHFRQKIEGKDEYAEGWANRLEYDGRGEKLKLSGQARLKRGEDELRGNLITYDSKTEYFQAQGSISGNPGRVRAVIRPKGDNAAPAVKP